MIFTTAVQGAPVHKDFLRNLAYLSDCLKTKVYVIPQLGYSKDDLPPVLPKNVYKLPFGMSTNTLQVTPALYLPHTNALQGELAERPYKVLGSPKQWLKSVSTGQGARIST